MKIDKSERHFWNKRKFKKVNEILDKEFANDKSKMGKCYIIWARKKQLLKEIYNIDWKTPAELNPGIMFD